MWIKNKVAADFDQNHLFKCISLVSLITFKLKLFQPNVCMLIPKLIVLQKVNQFWLWLYFEIEHKTANLWLGEQFPLNGKYTWFNNVLLVDSIDIALLFEQVYLVLLIEPVWYCSILFT